MKKACFPLLLITLLAGGSVIAQTKEKAPKERKDEIIIRKNPEAKEKTTIVIDGDEITVNGKPLAELKDSDIEVLREKAIAGIPHIRSRIANGLDMKKLSEGFAAAGNRPLLGVSSEKNEKGAKITEVSKGSAAEKAGLQKDDIITRIDGQHTITNSQDLYEAIGTYKPDDKITITYLRDGKEATTSATLGRTDSPRVRSFNFNGDEFRDFNFDMPQLRGLQHMDGFFDTRKPKLGVEIQDLEEGKGVKITNVNEGSAAAKAGLQKNDVVTSLDGKTISNVDELKDYLSGVKEGDNISIGYKRNGKPLTADIKFPRKMKTADL